MSFIAESFTFNELSTDDYGLMVYNIESSGQSAGSVGVNANIIEDRMISKVTPLHYGVSYDSGLSFDIMFGSYKKFSRDKIREVSAWLLHKDYKKLRIEQEDMQDVFFKAIVTELKLYEIAGEPVAFIATFSCDCPYAYAEPYIVHLTPGNNTVWCSGNVNDFYYPESIVISNSNITETTITNTTDDSYRMFRIRSNTTNDVITVDSCNQIITSEAGNISYIYDFCNFVFPRFLPGENTIVVTGNSTIDIVMSPFINIGY